MIALPLATFAHLASVEYQLRAAYEGPAVVMDAGMVLQVSAIETSAPLPERMVVALDQALPWVLVAWFAAVILFVARLNVGLLVCAQDEAGCDNAVPAELQAVFERCGDGLGWRARCG